MSTPLLISILALIVGVIGVLIAVNASRGGPRITTIETRPDDPHDETRP